ncbi:MAG TPA: hypothetical protein VEC39_18115 [Vicinamibacterales bacterium]|nr:hypothetical protein [Vicinamibacterales bacterium]
MSDAARRILLGILLLGVSGVTIELLLIGHNEDAVQAIPLALTAATFVTATLVALEPSAASIRLFQAVMVLMAVSAAVGMYLHFEVNMEFQLEMDPSLQGIDLFRKAILAKTPPALAPGTMMQLALIGLAYTFKHPATGRKA